jgi:hypothetical protein
MEFFPGGKSDRSLPYSAEVKKGIVPPLLLYVSIAWTRKKNYLYVGFCRM